MSVRIYELSKDIGMENADLIALLRERGYQVKSASSTVDNISAESLREEFGPKAAAPAAETDPEPAPKEPAPPSPPPSGANVRSKEEIERERADREAEDAKSKTPPPLTPPPPTGKAPPPLPSGPAVTIRKAPTPAAPAVSVPPNAPSLPRAPVLRTDVKETPKPKEAPAAPSAPSVPPRPAVNAPKPVAPPPVSAPRTLSPPPISQPPSIKPPVAEGPEETPAAPAAVPSLRNLQVKTPIVVRDFAIQIGRKPFQLISELMELGIFASMNTAVEEEVARRIAENAGFELEVRHRGEPTAPVKEEAEAVDESALLEPRPPVVCILGHVDHGKTTLLDSIRKANVVAGEAGGITQHIGAYQVEHNGNKISFIDTPGHAAFSNMRARGANTTDIAILVVAADDGFMPQTDEALGHARRAHVPVVVAINKVDAPGANIDRVMRQMQERDLTPEAWGGETLLAQVSALKREGIEDLLEAITLQAGIMETLKANPNADPEGVVIEAQKELGRGSTASVIVQKGTLKPGTALVCGENYCRVRQLIDDTGKAIKSAGPATPVKIVGWSGPPDAGDRFIAVKNERVARRMAEENELARKQLEAAQRAQTGGATLDDLFAAIAKTQKKTFRVLVKADVYGTAEAVATSLLGIKSDKIDLEVIDTGVGDVTKNDILKSDAGNAAVVAFNVGQEMGVGAVSKHHDVPIFKHNIIYELIDQVKDAMADELDPELRENKVGAAEVRAVFPLARSFVAGCMVTEGRIQRDYNARLLRGKDLVAESRIGTLKRFKDDVTEVRAGYECGVALQGVSDYREGDVIEVFEILKIKPSL